MKNFFEYVFLNIIENMKYFFDLDITEIPTQASLN